MFRSAIMAQTGYPNFRFDINLLRAVAFVVVLLYHFRVPGFDGGFVGVDIFLTISGYLMMSIISRELETGRFNLFGFYSRRIGRIIAPILPVAAATCMLGYFLLPPSAFASLGKHTIGMLTFTSNIMFWRDSGYFNDDSVYNFLLHSWSLSLEVQFYLVFPLILFALRALFSRRDNLIVPLVVLILVVFISSILATQWKPVPAFYLLPTRLWQFLLGGLICEVLRSPIGFQKRRVLHVIGLALIGASVAMIDSSMTWPGWRAGIPSLGVALVIYSNVSLPRIYESILLRFLGVISYSGYLWHWPIVVLLVISGKIENPLWQILGIVITLILASLSWYFPERRLGRWLQSLSTPKRLTAIGTLIGSVALLPGAALYTNGMPSRFTPDLNLFLSTAEVRPDPHLCGDKRQNNCIIGNPSLDGLGPMSSIGAIVVGDSHAAMISQIVADILPKPNSRVIALTLPACPTINGIRVKLDFIGSCAESIDRLLKIHNLAPSIPVIVANRYAFYMAGFNESARTAYPNYAPSQDSFTWSKAYVNVMSHGYLKTLCGVAKSGQLMIVYPFPEFDRAIPPRISLEIVLRGVYTDAVLTKAEYEARNVDVLPLLNRIVQECGAYPVDPLPALCMNDHCKGTREGSFLYTDSNHLTSAGAALLVETFSDVMETFALDRAN